MEKAHSLMGNFAEIATLTADPELRFTPSGRAVAQMRFAINSGYRNSSGEWVDDPATFLDGRLWNGVENAAESQRQGHRVLVIGELRTRTWRPRRVRGALRPTLRSPRSARPPASPPWR